MVDKRYVFHGWELRVWAWSAWSNSRLSCLRDAPEETTERTERTCLGYLRREHPGRGAFARIVCFATVVVTRTGRRISRYPLPVGYWSSKTRRRAREKESKKPSEPVQDAWVRTCIPRYTNILDSSADLLREHD